MATRIISARPDGRIRKTIAPKSTHQKIQELRKQLGIKETKVGVVHIPPVLHWQAGVFCNPKSM